MPNREDAFNLLKQYNGPALIAHGLAVESAMRHFAKKILKMKERGELWDCYMIQIITIS